MVQIDDGRGVRVALDPTGKRRRRLEMIEIQLVIRMTGQHPGAHHRVEVDHLIRRCRRQTSGEESGAVVLLKRKPHWNRSKTRRGATVGMTLSDIEIQRRGLNEKSRWVSRRRLNRAALTRTLVVTMTINIIIIIIIIHLLVVHVVRILDRKWKVGLGFGTTKLSGSRVVSTSGFFGRVKGSKPDTAFLPRVSNLSRISPPWPLPHSSKMHLLSDSITVTVSLDSSFSRRHVIEKKMSSSLTFFLRKTTVLLWFANGFNDKR